MVHQCCRRTAPNTMLGRLAELRCEPPERRGRTSTAAPRRFRSYTGRSRGPELPIAVASPHRMSPPGVHGLRDDSWLLPASKRRCRRGPRWPVGIEMRRTESPRGRARRCDVGDDLADHSAPFFRLRPRPDPERTCAAAMTSSHSGNGGRSWLVMLLYSAATDEGSSPASCMK